jgi:hypothetical protein
MATNLLDKPSQAQKHSAVERWFFIAVALAMIATSLAGFLPSIVNPGGRREPLSLLAASHGIVFFAWLLLFLIQSRLVATHRVLLHRRLGYVSIFILALMIPSGLLTTIAMVRRGFDLSGDLHLDGNADYEAVFSLFNLAIFYDSRNACHLLSAQAGNSQAFDAVRQHRTDACAADSPDWSRASLGSADAGDYHGAHLDVRASRNRQRFTVIQTDPQTYVGPCDPANDFRTS